MPRVLISSATLASTEGPHLQVLRDAGFEIVFPPQPKLLTEEDLLELVPGVHATLAGPEPYTPRVFEKAHELRVIARSGVGYDAVDVAAATQRGIAVTITPGTNHDAVAEQTFALIFALAKRVVSRHLEVKAGEWKRVPSLALRGATLGVVGLGRIGKTVALHGLGFGMRVLAAEAYPDHAFLERHAVTLLPLAELLRQADWVSLHAPLTPETRHLIDRHTLASMKPTAYLVNTARGGLVNEADLLEALKKGTIAGAALDVFEQEPPGVSPLFALPNVVLSPHIAGIDEQSWRDMALMAAQSIARLSRGDWPVEQVVNPEVRGRFRWG